MKFIILLAFAVAACLAVPLDDSKNAQILKYDNDNIGLGSYKYDFETSDGIKTEEQGELKNAGSENEAISVRGSYSYTGPDGQVYTVTYIADENGFQPQGAHLPVAPTA